MPPAREDARSQEKRDADQVAELLGHIFTVRKAIAEKHGKYKRGSSKNVQDAMPCPKCGAELRYTRASYNGHIWGQCTTKGCLSWME